MRSSPGTEEETGDSYIHTPHYLDSQVALVVKNPPTNAGDVRDAGSVCREDPLEEGMATYSSILAWRVPWTEEPGGLQRVQRVAKSWTQLKRFSTNACAFTLIQMISVLEGSSGISFKKLQTSTVALSAGLPFHVEAKKD